MNTNITLTSHEKSEFKRYNEACVKAGKSTYAELLVNDGVMNAGIYDRLASAYRKWLCFNEF